MVMTKQIYLIRAGEKETYSDFGKRIENCIAGIIKNEDIFRLSYTITLESPPAISVIPFKKEKIAAVSIWHNGSGFIASVLDQQGFSGVYTVTEALPVSYEKDWPDEMKTPGICLLTLFRKKQGIDRSVFLDRWFNGHTPLSLKIHPLWHYNRNVVERFMPENADPWEGIVEEHMRSRSELLNPFKFFGNPLVIIPRMIKVYSDTRSFIDYDTIEPYLVSEFIVKS